MTTNNLTEQWKKGELDRNKLYYYETPFMTTDSASGFWLSNTLDKEKDKVKILSEVPSYEQWQPFTDPYFRGLTTKDIAELAKKSIRLTTQHCKDNEEILKLKALLCQCEAELGLLEKKTPYIEDIIKKIKEVLK